MGSMPRDASTPSPLGFPARSVPPRLARRAPVRLVRRSPARPIGARLLSCRVVRRRDDVSGCPTMPSLRTRTLTGTGPTVDDSPGAATAASPLPRHPGATTRLPRPAGPVLDVGCGDGALLDALRARGRDAVGLERAAVRADVRAQELTEFTGAGRGVGRGRLLALARAPARSPGPRSTGPRSCSRPAGWWWSRYPTGPAGRLGGSGARWFALDLPRHLVHVPAAALLDALRARGLRIERVSYWRGGQVMFGWLQGLVGSLPGRPDLYDAIRVPAAQRRRLSGRSPAQRYWLPAWRWRPLPRVLAASEVAARAGGTVYVEARRP